MKSTEAAREFRGFILTSKESSFSYRAGRGGAGGGKGGGAAVLKLYRIYMYSISLRVEVFFG